MTIRIFILTLALSLFGCATVFQVKSDPLQADVYLQDPKSGEKKILGKTPLEMTTSILKQTAGENTTSGTYYTFFIEKQGFLSEKVMVPASRFGVLVTSLDIKLKQGNGSKEDRVAKDVLDYLFLAQKLARSGEYERAQIELEKVLSNVPNFPRALSMRASIYYMQKNYIESLKWYEEALKSDPQMEDAIKMLAKIRAIQNTGSTQANRQSPTKRGAN